MAGNQSRPNSFFRDVVGCVDCLRNNVGEKLSLLLARVTFVKKLLTAMTSSRESRDLLASMKQKLSAALSAPETDTGGDEEGREKTCPFTMDCSSCEGFMAQPVCLPCGHSLCKSCMERICTVSSPATLLSASSSLRCPSCQQTWPQIPPCFSRGRKPTVILQNVFQKWYPKLLEACKHREEGNCFAQEGDFPIAVHWYNKAFETGMSDHRVLGNRSRAFLAMEQLDAALRDAEACCRLRLHWAKGHFRRGAALEALGRWGESVAAYLLCLHLGGTDYSVVTSVCKILDEHLLEVAPPLGPPPTDTEGGGAASGDGGRASPEGVVDAVVGVCLKVMGEWEREGGAEEGVGEAEVPPEETDFECALCTGLLYKPVTVACGHSFCQSCLSRSFDHSPYCPVCRAPLAESFTQYCQKTGKINVDVLLESLLLHHFKEAYEGKRAQVKADTLRRSRVGLIESEELPMFVCTLAYPGIPCPLHIFEPRYRLMIRRCLETDSRRFGMCQPGGEESDTFTDIGTVLHINSVEYTPDGRCLISTVGESRFRTLNHGKRDGYHTASIEFITDVPVSGEEEIASLRALQQEVYDHAKRWLNSLPFFSQLLLIQRACSPLPHLEPTPESCTNGPMWVWWFVHVLPTTPQRKLEFLKCTSLRCRLLMLKESLPLPQQA